MVSLLPPAEVQFCDENGQPYAGGSLTFYTPGTLSLKPTYQDVNGTILNTNPVILDAAGRAVIFGTGTYQMVLNDSLGNQIWSQVTESSLPESDISAAMLPVVEANTLATARTLMGIDGEIQAAIAAVELLGGAAGPIGPTGPTGPAGPAGSQGGAAAGNSISIGNPGYWKDASTGFLIQFGSATTSGGNITINFPIPFAQNITSCIAVPYLNPINIVLRVSVANTTGFGIFTEDTDNHGGDSCSFFWLACGV